MVVERFVELIEAAAAGANPLLEFGESGLGCGQCLAVLVDAEDVDVVARAEQRCAVPSPAERGVDHGAGGDGGEQFGDLADHHGVVFERFVGAHRDTPAISCWPTSSLAR